MPASTARSVPRGTPQRAKISRFANLVPSTAEEFFRRRMTELGGLGQIAIAVVLVGALATFYAGDPSWDSALPAPWSHHTHNLLGLPGSYFSDIFIQTLGLASYLLPAAIAAWGARVLRHRLRSPLWQRLIILFPALIVSSAALAILKPFPSWPLAVSLGGSVGDSILKQSALGVTGLIGGGGVWIAWPIVALLAIVLLSATFGIRFRDWRAGFVAVAGATAWTGVRLGALRPRNDDAPAPARAKAAPRRQDPEFGGKVVAFSPAPKEIPQRRHRRGGRQPESQPAQRQRGAAETRGERRRAAFRQDPQGRATDGGGRAAHARLRAHRTRHQHDGRQSQRGDWNRRRIRFAEDDLARSLPGAGRGNPRFSRTISQRGAGGRNGPLGAYLQSSIRRRPGRRCWIRRCPTSVPSKRASNLRAHPNLLRPKPRPGGADHRYSG